MSESLDMPEAALLPPNDPLRQAWEAKIGTLPAEVQARWHQLNASAQAVRQEMRALNLPEGFQATLLAAADVEQARGGGTAGETGGGGAEGDLVEMEVASLLPPHDPLRRKWDARAGSAEGGALFDHWQQLVHESDALRAGLVAALDSLLPDELQQRLRTIPRASGRWRFRPLMRWTAAALAASLLFLAGTALWRVHLNSLDRRSLGVVAALVVKQYPSPPGLLVQSDDARIVAEALEKQGLDMPPIIIEYRRGGTHLTGGGVTKLNGEPAFFTLWEWRGKIFTLYQFRPKAFGLREDFANHDEVVSAGATTSCRIWYWAEPKYHCGWALVTTGPAAENPFVW